MSISQKLKIKATKYKALAVRSYLAKNYPTSIVYLLSSQSLEKAANVQNT